MSQVQRIFMAENKKKPQNQTHFAGCKNPAVDWKIYEGSDVSGQIKHTHKTPLK